MRLASGGRGWIMMTLFIWALCTYLFLHNSHSDLGSSIVPTSTGSRGTVMSIGGEYNLEDDYDDTAPGAVEMSLPSNQSSSSAPVPECDLYFYLRYWKRRFDPKDYFASPAGHVSGPSKVPFKERKFVVFQPDKGGWNNIRMAFETVVVFAHASGRTLVVPPKDNFYLLNSDPDARDNLLSFEHLLNLDVPGLDIVTMDEFIREVAYQGLLKKPYQDTYGANSTVFWKYIEEACYSRHWEPGKYHIGFNLSRTEDGKVTTFGTFQSKKVDSRQRVHASHARTLIPYDEELHSHRAIFFPGDYRIKYRILTHFYSYLYFAKKKEERKYMRLVRDRLRYRDTIFCAAGRVVKLLHHEASRLAAADMRRKGLSPVGGDRNAFKRHVAPAELAEPPSRYHPVTGGGDIEKGSTYFAYHIRRNDFQYVATRLSGDEIYNNTKHLLDRGVSQVIFISTDEKNKKEFQAFKGGTDRDTNHPRFVVRFLRDYLEKAALSHDHGISPNLFGMIEQLICANAHTFFGTPLSTFTGYITRLRGYYRDDRYANTFYWMPDSMYVLHRRTTLKGPFWAREFATAHEDIDDDAVAPPRTANTKARRRHSQGMKRARDLDYIVRDSYK